MSSTNTDINMHSVCLCDLFITGWPTHDCYGLKVVSKTKSQLDSNLITERVRLINYLYYSDTCLNWTQLTLWVWIPLGWGVLDTALCDKVLDTKFCAEVCQKIMAGQWFSLGTPVSIQQKNWPPRYTCNWNIVESYDNDINVALNRTLNKLKTCTNHTLNKDPM